MIRRDGHVHVLPLHVANKIAAGEVVERPASVVKELVENAIDAGAKTIRITIAQGGRKLVAVQDDGCGMTKEDAILSLERQATSKILDVDDIEEIDTLGFRGEAIPSIASVSRFTLTTRPHDSDEGTLLQVEAGRLAEIRAAGCPPGTLVEVRDLFCNVPARRKFLRAAATEESHIRQIFTVHALAHPTISFALTIDGRELYRLAPAATLADRLLDLFGKDFTAELLPVVPTDATIRVSGYLERPNLNLPTRRDQQIFINGRPASAPAITYALREAYPRRPGEVRPAAILFIDLPPNQVDVNVHPAKREVRFRNSAALKQALLDALHAALNQAVQSSPPPQAPQGEPHDAVPAPVVTPADRPVPVPPQAPPPTVAVPTPASAAVPTAAPLPMPVPVQVEFAVAPDSTQSRPWAWFRFLAQTSTGYLLLETDAGLVTLNPRAARERIIYERLLAAAERDDDARAATSQTLLLPETIQLAPADAARLRAALPVLRALGFALEEFGRDTFKLDAVPHELNGAPAAAVLTTIARDLAEAGTKRGSTRWREELIARAVARASSGASTALTEAAAVKLVEELCVCRMPYICPRGKITLTLTSTRELNRKFGRD